MRRADVASGGAAALVGVAAWALTLRFPPMPEGHPGPALFPRLVAALLVLFGAVLAWQGLRAPAPAGTADETAPDPGLPGVLNALLVAASVAVYMVVVDAAGFPLTVAGLNLLLMWRLGVRPRTAIPVAAALGTGIYFVFARLLLVPLPRGPFPG